MGTAVEVLSDDRGIIWPDSIAPFRLHLLSLSEDKKIQTEANAVYERLLGENIEVLFDDREGISAGEKFAEADLLGLPYRAVISERSLKEKGIELKRRTEEKGEVVSSEELIKVLKSRT